MNRITLTLAICAAFAAGFVLKDLGGDFEREAAARSDGYVDGALTVLEASQHIRGELRAERDAAEASARERAALAEGNARLARIGVDLAEYWKGQCGPYVRL